MLNSFFLNFYVKNYHFYKVFMISQIHKLFMIKLPIIFLIEEFLILLKNLSILLFN